MVDMTNAYHPSALPTGPGTTTRRPDAGLPLGWLLVVLAFLLPVLGYVLLPLLGVGKFAEMFNLKRVILLFGAVVGGVAYLYYLRFVLCRPQILAGFLIIAWPPVAYFNALLMSVGLNIHLRPLLFLAVAFPALWISLRHGWQLLQQLPWLKYYLAFFLWLVLYSLVYNANAVDPRLSGGAEADGDGSVSLVQLFAYFYCLMGITVSAVAVLKARNYQGLFDTLNKALLLVSSLEALAAILGYPFSIFTLIVDGFTRSIGIFSHPNPFSHHMGILMIYLMGLFCYYQDEKKARMPGWLLLGGIGLNFVAFLLGFSKTALAVFGLCTALMFLLNLAVPQVRRSFLQIALAVIILVPIGLLGFEALSGQSFFGMLESRIDDTNSLSWRTQVWQDLLAEINLGTAWLGHGFTSANATVFRLTFNDSKNAQPLMMVHNAYIALIYDLGIMGYLMFVSAISLMFAAIRGWLAAIRPALRTEASIILALTIYFLVVCGFDEMSYMFDAPMLFWCLATLLFCVSWREAQDARHEQRRQPRIREAGR